MTLPAARALDATLAHGALEGWFLLAGKAVSLELRGGEESWPLFAPHASPPPKRSGSAGALSLRLRVHPGPPPRFDHLAVQARGDGFLCEGDGLRGEVGPSAATLDVYGGEPALLAALRLCIAVALAADGGLLLHGACVELGGRALAFLGASGAGKTTLSRRLAQAGARPISDEVTAVRGPLVYGHPFPRRLGDGCAPPGGLPLDALGFLAQAPAGQGPARRRLSPREAARALLERVFLPVRSPALLGPVLAAVSRLAESVPAWALTLPDDARAAGCALSLAGGG